MGGVQRPLLARTLINTRHIWRTGKIEEKKKQLLKKETTPPKLAVLIIIILYACVLWSPAAAVKSSLIRCRRRRRRRRRLHHMCQACRRVWRGVCEKKKETFVRAVAVVSDMSLRYCYCSACVILPANAYLVTAAARVCVYIDIDMRAQWVCTVGGGRGGPTRIGFI